MHVIPIRSVPFFSVDSLILTMLSWRLSAAVAAALLRHLYPIHIGAPTLQGARWGQLYEVWVPQSSHERWMTAGIIYLHDAQYVACIL